MAKFAYAVAPKGKESVVLAIAYLPFILSIVISGIAGGLLMEAYCPEDGDRECWKAWGIITILAVPGILILIIFRSCLENKKFEEQPFMPCSLEAKHE